MIYANTNNCDGNVYRSPIYSGKVLAQGESKGNYGTNKRPHAVHNYDIHTGKINRKQINQVYFYCAYPYINTFVQGTLQSELRHVKIQIYKNMYTEVSKNSFNCTKK